MDEYKGSGLCISHYMYSLSMVKRTESNPKYPGFEVQRLAPQPLHFYAGQHDRPNFAQFFAQYPFLSPRRSTFTVLFFQHCVQVFLFLINTPSHKYFSFRGIFWIFKYFIQHCFICRPSDSTVPVNAGSEPRTVATMALAVRRSNHINMHGKITALSRVLK